MSDYLLQGWKEIHEKLFCREDGRPVTSLSTLMQKHGPGLKEVWAVFQWHRGRVGRPVIAGWRSIIQNYFIRLQQETYEAKKKGLNCWGRL